MVMGPMVKGHIFLNIENFAEKNQSFNFFNQIFLEIKTYFQFLHFRLTQSPLIALRLMLTCSYVHILALLGLLPCFTNLIPKKL